MTGSDLVIEILGGGRMLPPFSAGECTQTLTPLSGCFRRTINGQLVFLGHEGYQKFTSTLSGEDKIPPCFDHIWPGAPLKVGCIQPLTQFVSGGTESITLSRDAFGPVHLYDMSLKEHSIRGSAGRDIDLPSAFGGGFITYRPWLIMVVKSYQIKTDEWDVSQGWTLELEEI